MTGRSFTYTTALLLALGTGAQAASQGQLTEGSSARSSASLQVGLMVRDMVRISQVDDLMLQWRPGEQRFHARDKLCVYRNMAGRYSVAVTSAHGGDNGFVMKGGDDSALAYQVSWNGQPLDAGQRTEALADADTANIDCGGNGNVALDVSASQQQASQATDTGLHTDTLTLAIIAE